jgi:hypothetical protein
MRLSKARVQNYRSIIDTGWFDVEDAKTILVGPNEAGKTALLQAIQQINPPEGVAKFDALRDFPRAHYNDITTGKVNAANVTVVEGHFTLEPDDQELIPENFKDCIYVLGRRLDNNYWHRLDGGPQVPTYGEIRKGLIRLCSHIDSRIPKVEGQPETKKHSIQLATITKGWTDTTRITNDYPKALLAWLDSILGLVDENNKDEEKRFDKIRQVVTAAEEWKTVLTTLRNRLPIFVLFNNYFRVRPRIHLDHLASRLEANTLDDNQYDYGNQCLLKLLGFSARQLSNLGRTPEPQPGKPDALQTYRDALDKRSYQLNAASVRLTDYIRNVWFPNPDRAEADRLRVIADSQYLKVVVEDELGVEIELDQRSEGFQWLVSFFVVFFAETTDKHKNAILLLAACRRSKHVNNLNSNVMPNWQLICSNRDQKA